MKEETNVKQWLGKLTAGAAALLLTATLGGAVIGAADREAPVSPALNILSRDLTMVKSVTGRQDVAFTAADFEEALGVSRLDSIVIRELPSPVDGKLMLGSLEVMKNQTVTRNHLSSLRFCPTGQGSRVEFVFEAGRETDYAVTCVLHFLEKENYAPTSVGIEKQRFTLQTYKNIALYGTLPAMDPEGDGLTFEVISYPKKGLLTVTDRGDGQFIYTPVKNYAGKDSFTYVVTDEYGNRSDEIRMTVQVDASEHGTVFEDMIGHWAHYSAIRLSDEGIMKGQVEGEVNRFAPEEAVTRAECLAMIMMTAGIEGLPSDEAVTVFHDGGEIPEAYRGYVRLAYERGYIRGYEEDGLPMFDPNGSVTRAEACVMIDKVLDLASPLIKPVFADGEAIPSWAKDSMETLTALGILSGTGDGYISPDEELDRAQMAEMLSAVLDMER